MALIITAAEVNAALGSNVTTAQVQTAQDVVETVTGSDLLSDNPAARFIPSDLRKLRLAVQWQAPYVATHPDLLTRDPAVQSASANGASVTYAAAAPGSSPLLAPAAAAVLAGLSWKRGRIRVSTPRSSRDRSHLRSQDTVHDEGRQPWRPL